MSGSALVGLIGAKIQHSLAPALFEDACGALGARGHYHLMDLDLLVGRTLPDLLAAVRAAGFRGVNVTFPCKEAVLPLLDEVSAEARRIGAVNTVTIDPAGHTIGHNTDCIGFRRSFEESFGRDAAAGVSVLLVGAGGAGRAVAFALFDLGIRELILSDRSQRQAEGLAGALRAHFGEASCRVTAEPETALASVAGVVNATPVGMSGVPGLPIAVENITDRHFAADVIYSPLETAFLKAAYQKGARVMGGAGMCIHQAAEAFRLFTGSGADIERMRRTFETMAARRTIDRP
jgi:shikimate dehydrogenase